jgi:hypothetical protein
MYNDLLPGDMTKEVRGTILTQPSAGTLYAYEDSSFDFTGAPPGAYSFDYRLFIDGVDQGTATVFLAVGPSSLAALTITTDGAVFSGVAVTNQPSRVSFGLTADPGIWYGLAGAGGSTVVPGIARPYSDIITAGWTPTNAPTCFGAVDEAAADDSDYVSRPITGNEPLVLGLRLGAGTHTIRIRPWVPGGSGQFKVTLQDINGVDLGSSPWIAVGASPATYSATVTIFGACERIRIDAQS